MKNNNKINKIIFSILLACGIVSASAIEHPMSGSEKHRLLEKYSYVSADNPNVKNGTPVLFFTGFSTQGGILPLVIDNIRNKMQENSKLVNNISKFIMIQWPGAELTKWGNIPLEPGSYASEEINSLPDSLVKEDMQILKELKEQNSGKLHLVGFSWGGLRAMMAYLHLTKEEREGISLSLVDPLIPSLAVGKYKNLANTAEISNILGNSKFAKDFRDCTLACFFRHGNKEQEILIKGKPMDLVRHCWQQEKIIREKFSQQQNGSLDIRQIALMGAKDPNGKDGLGTSEEYVNFFMAEVLPKCNTSANGNILEVMKYSHNTFIGSEGGLYNGTDAFIKWMNQAVQKKSRFDSCTIS